VYLQCYTTTRAPALYLSTFETRTLPETQISPEDLIDFLVVLVQLHYTTQRRNFETHPHQAVQAPMRGHASLTVPARPRPHPLHTLAAPPIRIRPL